MAKYIKDKAICSQKIYTRLKQKNLTAKPIIPRSQKMPPGDSVIARLDCIYKYIATGVPVFYRAVRYRSTVMVFLRCSMFCCQPKPRPSSKQATRRSSPQRVVSNSRSAKFDRRSWPRLSSTTPRRRPLPRRPSPRRRSRCRDRRRHNIRSVLRRRLRSCPHRCRHGPRGWRLKHQVEPPVKRGFREVPMESRIKTATFEESHIVRESNILYTHPL